MNTIDSIKNWFQQAVPTPTDNSRAVQIGCHFEEVGEMLETLPVFAPCLRDNLHDVAHEFKERREVDIDAVDRKELLDALCDQIVTAIGVAHMFNMDVSGALAEVDRSNWSKFVDGKPVFKPNGKIGKGPEYKEPNLAPFA